MTKAHTSTGQVTTVERTAMHEQGARIADELDTQPDEPMTEAALYALVDEVTASPREAQYLLASLPPTTGTRGAYAAEVRAVTA